MEIKAFEQKDREIADKMIKDLKYLLAKYTWLEVYHGVWNSMANRMCGSVEASCLIISERKRAAYERLAREEQYNQKKK
ncbi:MAG: hypothetical protein V1934_01000 [Methanobacteriota archaeon]